MRRGELYRVRHPGGDPKRSRVFAVVGRQAVIASSFSSVICAPVYSAHHGLSSEVAIGPNEGLKHDSAIACDALVSVAKSRLTDFVGSLNARALERLDAALAIAVGLREPDG